MGGDGVKVQVVHSHILPSVQVLGHQHALWLVRSGVVDIHMTHSAVLQQQHNISVGQPT